MTVIYSIQANSTLGKIGKWTWTDRVIYHLPHFQSTTHTYLPVCFLHMLHVKIVKWKSHKEYATTRSMEYHLPDVSA